MNIRKSILSFFGKTCTACVGLALLFYILLAILSQSSLSIVQALPVGQFLLLLLTAALLNVAAYLLRLPLPKAVCVLLHYITCILSLFITFLFSGKIAVNAANILVFLVIFSFFYGLYWGALLLFRFLLFPEKRREKTKKEQKREAEYVNRF